MKLEGLLKNILNWVLAGYENNYKYFFGDLIFGFFESLFNCGPSCSYVGAWKNGFRSEDGFLIGTKGLGILLLDQEGGCRRAYAGKEVYGISYHDKTDRWYAFEKQRLHGRIISFKFHDDSLEDFRVEYFGLSKGCHQILILDSVLYVTDTYNNCVLAFDLKSEKKRNFWKFKSKKIFPNGLLLNKRSSENYNHFNSIYFDGDCIILVAHNETYKSGRLSQLYFLSRESMGVEKFELLDGSNCHNVGRWHDEVVYCDSLNFELVVGDKRIKSRGFTRGICANKEYLLCGFSPYQTDRSFRGVGEGGVLLYDRQLRCVDEIVIPDVQIQEIRCCNNHHDFFHHYYAPSVVH